MTVQAFRDSGRRDSNPVYQVVPVQHSMWPVSAVRLRAVLRLGVNGLVRILRFIILVPSV